MPPKAKAAPAATKTTTSAPVAAQKKTASKKAAVVEVLEDDEEVPVVTTKAAKGKAAKAVEAPVAAPKAAPKAKAAAVIEAPKAAPKAKAAAVIEAPVAAPKAATKATKATKAAPVVVEEPVVEQKATKTKTATKVVEKVAEPVAKKAAKQAAPAPVQDSFDIKAENIANAIKALRQHLKIEKEKATLGAGEDYLELQINLSKSSNVKKSHSIPIPHSIYKRKGVSICLLTKDSQSDWEEFVMKNPVENVTRVIALKKLATDFHPYEHRRLLNKQHDLFLADEAIMPMLSKLLGRDFYTSQQAPIKVNLSTQYNRQVPKARDSTHFTIPTGPTFIVRAGHSTQSDKFIQENIIALLPKLKAYCPQIQSIQLRTGKSIALPLYINLSHSTTSAQNVRELKSEKEVAVLKKRAKQHKLTPEVFINSLKRAHTAGITFEKYIDTVKSKKLKAGAAVPRSKAKISNTKVVPKKVLPKKISPKQIAKIAALKARQTKAVAAPVSTKKAAPAPTPVAKAAKGKAAAAPKVTMTDAEEQPKKATTAKKAPATKAAAPPSPAPAATKKASTTTPAATKRKSAPAAQQDDVPQVAKRTRRTKAE